jgi:hypothetical protein
MGRWKRREERANKRIAKEGEEGENREKRGRSEGRESESGEGPGKVKTAGIR